MYVNKKTIIYGVVMIHRNNDKTINKETSCNVPKINFATNPFTTKKPIESLLQAITDGVNKGKLCFSDETGEITLQPDGLLRLKISAYKGDGLNRFNIRVSWQDKKPKRSSQKQIEIHSKPKSQRKK